jgi:hypothetical protein
MPPPDYKASDVSGANSKQQQPSGSNVHAAAAARVAASIALLSSHRVPFDASDMSPRGAAARPGAGEGIAGDEEQQQSHQWLPPADQSGDGRTSLNAKLGY